MFVPTMRQDATEWRTAGTSAVLTLTLDFREKVQ